MRRFSVLALVLTVACASSPSTSPVQTPPQPPPPPPAVNNLRYFGYWLDAGKATGDHANTIDFLWPDDVFVANTDENWNALLANANVAVAAGRKLVVWTPFFRFGPTSRSDHGYYWAEDGEAKWAARAESLRPLLPSVIAFYLMDEPDMSAWGDIAPGGSYDPNLYNDLLKRGVDVIRSTFPGAPVALNYGAVAGNLVVPEWLTWVGLEAYGADLATFDFLRVLKTKLRPGQGVMIMPEATVSDAHPDKGDAIVAQWARDQYAYASADPQIIGLRPFMWCVDRLPTCDNSHTAADPTWYVGGDHMPLTQQAFRSIGQAITGRH